MTNEAIILAGGIGKRLKSVVNDTPKPMALINQKPFLEYVFDYLYLKGINKVILSVGYKYEIIKNHFGSNYNNIKILYAVEKEPLGTGGGIKNALQYTQNEKIFILNGDSFFKIEYKLMFKKHLKKNADITIALKFINNINRYGVVQIEGDKVLNFCEKQKKNKGFINGGVYIINKKIFDFFKGIKNFSFEYDFLEKRVHKLDIRAYICDGYFIDIGVPISYIKAQNELNF